MSSSTTVKCPNCGADINVNEVLYHQLENELKQKNDAAIKDLEKEIEQKRKEYKKAFDNLKNKEEEIKNMQNSFNEKLKEATSQALKEEKLKLKEQLKKELEEENSEYVAVLKRELEEKSDKIKELNKSKAEIEKLKREKDEIRSKIKAEAELELTKRLQDEREVIEKTIEQQNELKLKEKDEKLKQLQEQLKIAQRKAEQGSMQLQGEVQELAIEEYLNAFYPFDTIEEIKKGAKGADCIQIINTREFINCGKIYYESKRTKDFQKTWIEKFKNDIIDKGADIGVLVTQTLPDGMERMGLYEGIWVCTFEEFKGLSAVLRESIIKISLAKKGQENKTDKMNMLYNYLTSPEFSMQIEAIVDSFTQMKEDLEREKRSMQKIWKQREKQIDRVTNNTINMYGSIKGIAGNSINKVKTLELPYDEGDESV